MKASIYITGLFVIITCTDVIAQMVSRGPYLQNPTSQSIVVMWRTDVSEIGQVRYGTDPANLDNSMSETSAAMDHSVKVTGLQPFTKYFYSIGSGTATYSGPDSNHHFITSPVPGTVQPIRVWAIGDFGKNNNPQKWVRDSYVNYTTDHHTDVWLWLGDNAYDNGTDQEYQDKVFDSVNAYHNVMKYLPFMPCPGNHDYGSVCPIPCANGDPRNHTGPYYNMIDVPTNGEAGGVASGYELFYSFDYGNVHFISLNSELGSSTAAYDWTGAGAVNPLFSIPEFTSSPMSEWLEADLQANKQPWVIAYWHQVGYTKGSHDSDDLWEWYMQAMREHFHPILEKHGVDLVVCGHSHVYERSYLIKGHYGNSSAWDSTTMVVDGSSGNYDMGEPYTKKTYGPKANEGTVYLTVGNSGNSENNPPLDYPAMYFGYGGNSSLNDPGIGSLVLDISGDRLDAKYLKYDGTIIDEFTMLKEDSTTTSIKAVSPSSMTLNVAPNPFNESTTLSYSLDQQQKISIKVYDLGGKQVAQLFEGIQYPGVHTIVLNGDDLGLERGVYVIRIENGTQIQSEKVIKFR